MKKKLAYPYGLWSLAFIVAPLLLVLLFSLTLGDSHGGLRGLTFSMDNFTRLANPVYVKVFLRSINLAIVSTVICLALGYPVAYILANQDLSRRNLLIMLFVVPMWMNFLLRTYAWMSILGKNGFVNTALTLMNLPNIDLLYNSGAVVLGMVYNFLPFMVLPIYSVLSKMDQSLVEAAEDLGAGRLTVFRRVILPLSLPGVYSGIIMVFMPAVSTFVISRLLGGGQYMLIGNLVEQQFLYVGDWHFGSAVSIVMMIMILIAMAFLSSGGDKEGEVGLF